MRSAATSTAFNMREQVVFLWSGGKDSALALARLLGGDGYDVVALLTTVAEPYRRVSHHGVREELLDRQSAAMGIPVEKLYLPSSSGQPCTNDHYESVLGAALSRYRDDGIRFVGCGDIFLHDIRQYRERHFAQHGVEGVFPLWQMDTTLLAREFIDRGFQARLSFVQERLGPTMVGRAFDDSFLDDLPEEVDPCGENGEFHSFVWDAPMFAYPIEVVVGEVVQRDGHFYADLFPNDCDEADRVSIPPMQRSGGSTS